MKKNQFMAAATGTSVLAGLLGIMLLGGMGFSIARLTDPVFYAEAITLYAWNILLGLVLIGVSLGALFSAARFIGKIQAAVLGALTSLIVVMIGTTFFWQQISSYTIIAFGYFLGATFASLCASQAKGSSFNIGFEHTKKATAVLAVVALVGSFLLVASADRDYRDQFKRGVTGISAMSLDSMNDSEIAGLIIAKTPKMSWENFSAQLAPPYDTLTEADKADARKWYEENYTVNYEAQVAQAVKDTREQLDKSQAAADLALSATSFGQLVMDNIALFYALSLALMMVTAQAIIVAPSAGLTSWLFHRPLTNLRGKKEEEFTAVWDDKIVITRKQ